MQPNLKDIVMQIFTLIFFEEDKEAYANEFVEYCRKQAMVSTLEALPEDQKEALRQKIAGGITKEESERILIEYLGSEKYLEELKKTVQTTLGELMDTLAPKMSDEQKRQIQAYFVSLQQSNVSSVTTSAELEKKTA